MTSPSSASLPSDLTVRTATPPSAGVSWHRVPAITCSVLDSFTARARRIATDLTGCIRSERLDGVEAEIVNAIADLKSLRIHVRQLRAAAKAERRAAA